MPEEVCPECGSQRVGALRFCLQCGFDLDDRPADARPAAEAGRSADVPPATVGPTEPTGVDPATDDPDAALRAAAARSMLPPTESSGLAGLARSRWVRVGIGLMMVALTVAVVIALGRPGGPRGAAGASSSPNAADQTAGASLPASASVRASDSGAPASAAVSPPAPSAAGSQAATLFPAETHVAGETVTVSADGAPYLQITVDRIGIVPRYIGPTYVDTPRTSGNVFIQARVTYLALGERAVYNRFDWRAFVNGVATDAFTAITEGPKPEVGAGELARGGTRQGWLVYEVPAVGQVVLSYTGSFRTGDPLFAFVIRPA